MAKTAAKPAKSKGAQPASKPAAKVAAPKVVALVATSAPAATKKPAPPAAVSTYIASLGSAPEQRYAAKVWRHLAGHRKSQGSLRGITQEQAKSIREGVQAAVV